MKSLFVTFLFSMSILAGPNNKELRIGVSQEFENLNPLVTTMRVTGYIYDMTNRRLAILDPYGKWRPSLAESIPSLANNTAKLVGDGNNRHLMFTWKLRETAKWGDGKPVTCHDLKLAWEIALDPKTSAPDRHTYEQIQSIVVDKKNPKFCHMKAKARWDFYKARLSLLPAHLEGPIYQKYKNVPFGYERNSNYSKKPTLPGLYFGPYRVSDIKLGSHVTLVRNKTFYGKKPFFDRVIVRLIPNTGTLEANLRSSTIDMISFLGLSFDQALAFEKKAKNEKLPFRVNFQPSMLYEHIKLNLDNPILKNVNVRKALLFSINKAELTNALFEGRQQPASHIFAPSDPWYTTDSKKIVLYPYSQRKAKELLEKAGWKMAENGYRYKDGKKLSLPLLTTAGNKVRELVQVYLQNQWKKVGIEILIKNQPARVLFGDTLKKRKFAMLMAASVSAPEINPKETVHSQKIPTEANNFSGRNRSGWVNQKVDQLVEKIDLQFDKKIRMQMAHEFLYHYTADVPTIPLYYRSDVSVTPSDMTGYKLPGHLYSVTNHIEEWRR